MKITSFDQSGTQTVDYSSLFSDWERRGWRVPDRTRNAFSNLNTDLKIRFSTSDTPGPEPVEEFVLFYFQDKNSWKRDYHWKNAPKSDAPNGIYWRRYENSPFATRLVE